MDRFEDHLGTAFVIICAVLLFLGLVSYAIDRTERTPEPCTLACER